MDTSNLISNMKLVHDIVVDDEFVIEKPTPPDGRLVSIIVSVHLPAQVLYIAELL